MFKVFTIIVLCVLTIYAPLELSRLIVAYGLEAATIFELCFMWTFYLTALIMLTKVVKV